MILANNPSEDKIQELIELSKDKAAKWIEDKDSGDKWFWPSDKSFHKDVAKLLHIENYDKGLAVKD